MTPRLLRRLTPALLLALPVLCATAGPDNDLFRAIRANDPQLVKAALRAGAAAEAADSTGTTAVMYSALHADAAVMKLLLDKGANPNAAAPSGVTALMLSVGDVQKVEVLLARGADPNARSKEGRTPLMIAARRAGSAPVMRLLLDRGAKANATDNERGTALMLAAEAGDIEVVKLLLERGADVNAQASPMFGIPRFGNGPPGAPPPGMGMTALTAAVYGANLDVVRLLLDRGADPNRRFLMGTALTLAVFRGTEMVRLLLEHGASVEGRDMRQATPLVLAAASDRATPEMIAMLLDKGADPNAKDGQGKTALEWASMRGRTDVVAALRGHGKSREERIVEAVNRSLALLQPSADQFSKKSGCLSCHHNSLTQIAVAAARARGFAVDDRLAASQTASILGVAAPHRDTVLQAVATIPAATFVSSYALVGLAAEKYAADETTDALVFELAGRQRGDGRWQGDESRPPLDQSNITSTALTLRALQLYGSPGRKKEYDERVRRAAAWLAAAEAATTQEKAMRLLGLAWAMTDRAAIRAAAEDLLGEQRADGGWSQLRTLESDAYATGEVLVALYESGIVKAGDEPYRRGAEFLLDTQLDDGSWHVRSRAMGFQKYFESGYPHGRDQWISAAGGSWATLALALTREPRRQVAQVMPMPGSR